jgi:hypothetical protein
VVSRSAYSVALVFLVEALLPVVSAASAAVVSPADWCSWISHSAGAS